MAILIIVYYLIFSSTATPLATAVLRRRSCHRRPFLGNMSIPDEIIANTDSNAFGLVVGAPTDNNVEQICRTVINFPQSFSYHGIQVRLSRIIEFQTKHRYRFVHAFDCLEMSDAENYDPNMKSKPEIGKCS